MVDELYHSASFSVKNYQGAVECDLRFKTLEGFVSGVLNTIEEFHKAGYTLSAGWIEEMEARSERAKEAAETKKQAAPAGPPTATERPPKSWIKRANAEWAPSGNPICPEHKVEMQPKANGVYMCPEKDAQGNWCRYAVGKY